MSSETARKIGKVGECDIPDVDATAFTLAPTLVSEITFDDLRVYASDQIAGQVRQGKTEEQIKQEIGQTMSALKRAKNGAGSSSVRSSIEKEIKRAEEDARKGNRNPKRRAIILLKLLEQFETRRCNEVRSTEEVGPEAAQGPRRSPFGKSIVLGREAKGLSQTELAEKLEICSATMSRWEHDTIPLGDDKTHNIVNKMEIILEYGTDYQWGLIADTARQLAEWPEEIPDDDWLRRRISESVGNLRGLSEAERQARRLAAYEEIKSEDEKAVRFESYSLGMDLNFSRWPELLAVDWIELLQAHMAFEKLPDARQHLVPPPEKADPWFKVDRTTGKELYTTGWPMRQATAEYNSKAVSLIFGSCINPIKTRESDEQAARVRLAPILAVQDVASIGMALAVCPELVEHYFRAQRIMRALLRKPAELSKRHVKYINVLKKMVKWMAQQPHFVDRLRPIDGLLSPKQIEGARRDWRVFCEKTVQRYEQIYEGKRHNAAESFDHGTEIEAFLVNQPQEGLLAIFDSFADDLASSKERDQARAIKLRNATAVALKALCYYRPGTDQLLDWRADNTGHLRHHVHGGLKTWHMHLSKRDVKNHYSKAMKDGEDRLLHNIGGRFYAILEEYLAWARSFLLAGRITDALIVRCFEDPRHTRDSYGTYVRRLTSRAMKEEKPEFQGATALNCIQIRKAGASDAYQEEGTMEAAGKAIGNTAKEAQVYVKVLASVRTKQSTERTRRADERRGNPKPPSPIIARHLA